MVHLRVKGETEYTGPESYVKDMLVKGDFSFFPVLKTSSIIVEDVSNEVLLERVNDLSKQVASKTAAIEAQMEATRSELVMASKTELEE